MQHPILFASFHLPSLRLLQFQLFSSHSISFNISPPPPPPPSQAANQQPFLSLSISSHIHPSSSFIHPSSTLALSLPNPILTHPLPPPPFHPSSPLFSVPSSSSSTFPFPPSCDSPPYSPSPSSTGERLLNN